MYHHTSFLTLGLAHSSEVISKFDDSKVVLQGRLTGEQSKTHVKAHVKNCFMGHKSASVSFYHLALWENQSTLWDFQ